METKFCYSSSSCSLRVLARAFICFQFASKGCVDVFSANAPTWSMAQKAQPLCHCYEIVLHSIDTSIFSELSLPLLHRVSNLPSTFNLIVQSSVLFFFVFIGWTVPIPGKYSTSKWWSGIHDQWWWFQRTELATIGEHSTSSANCPTAANERPP